jgi:hypothetical protein
MLKFKKPRYKFYNSLLENVRNDFKLEKFKSLKWLKLKSELKKKIFLKSDKLFFDKLKKNISVQKN